MAETVGTIQSFGVLNYSGSLFNKGNVDTPFLSMLAGKMKTTQAVEFVMGQEYATEGGTQPAISETASLTAPDAAYITRAQKTNVTQIYHESVAISYAKMSNMNTLSGSNVEGQVANPKAELDFQIGAKLSKIQRDMEIAFLKGTYNKATTDAEINKTRGIVPAITTNVVAAAGATLSLWLINSLATTMKAHHAKINNLVLWTDAIGMNQLSNDAIKNHYTIVPANANIAGFSLDTLRLPVGATVKIMVDSDVTAGETYLFNFDPIYPVEQPVPDKGNFFYEPLAKTGAGEKGQIFGQMGLDYGMEWLHGKITGLSTTFTADMAMDVKTQPLYPVTITTIPATAVDAATKDVVVVTSPADATLTVTSGTPANVTVGVVGHTITLTRVANGASTITVKASRNDYSDGSTTFVATASGVT